MKRSLKLIVFALVIMVLLNGCIKMKRVINLNKDGSGTIEEFFVMKNMGFGQSQDFDEEELKSAAASYGNGVVFKSGEEVVVGEMKGYKAVYAFENINDLTIQEDMTNEIFSSDMDPNEEKGYIKFDFDKGSTSTLKIQFPQDMEDEEAMEEGEWEDEPETNPSEEEMAQAQEMAKQMYSGMEMSFKINFNGKIVSSDASFAEDNCIILMDMDFDKILENEDALKKLTMNQDADEEEMKKMFENTPGVKMEFKKEISVKFK